MRGLTRTVLLAAAGLLLGPAAAFAAPAPTITGGPAEGSYSQLDFPHFVLDGGGGTITGCTLDERPLANCRAGDREVSVGPGAHVLVVTSQDAAGESATAVRRWTVDTDRPEVAITGDPGLDTTTRATDAALTVAAADASPLRLECALGDAVQPCAPGDVRRFSGLPDGSYTFTLTATDAAGNSTEAIWRWRVDTVAPVAVVDGGPLEGTTSLERSPIMRAILDSDGIAECSVDGAPFTRCSSPIAIGPLADGAHSVSARGTDFAGNVGPVATRRFNTGDPILLGQVPKPLPKVVVPTALAKVKVVVLAGRRLSVAVTVKRGTAGTVRIERRVRGRWKLQLAGRFGASRAGTVKVTLPARRTSHLPRGRYRVLVRTPDSTVQLVSSALTLR